MEHSPLLTQLFDSVADAIYLIEIDTCRLLDANRQAYRNLGFESREQLLQQPLRDLNNEIYTHEQLQAFAQRLADEGPKVLTGVQQRRDGSTFPVEVQLSLYQPEDGPLLLLGIARDISKRQALFDQLQQRNATLQATLEASADAILVVNSDRQITDFNQRFCQMWQLRTEQLANADDRLLAEQASKQLKDPEQFLAHLDDLEHNPEHSTRDKIHFLDGRIYLRRSRPQYLDGSVVGRVWSFTEVTLAERVQQNLSEQQSLLRTVIDAIPDLIFFKDREGHYLGCNQAYEQFSGRSKSELHGKTDLDLFPRQEAELFRSNDAAVLSSQSAAYYHEWASSNHGKRILFESIKAPIHDHQAQLTGVVGISRDITQRDEMERFQRAIQLTTQDGFFVMDEQGHFLECNDHYQMLLGYPRDLLLQMTLADVEIDENPSQVREHMARIRHQGSDLFATRQRTANGQILDLEISSTYVPSADPLAPDHGRFLVFVRDIRARLQAQAQHRLSEQVFNTTSEGIFITDAEGIIKTVNQAFTVLTGYSAEEAIGQTPNLMRSGRQSDAFYAQMWEQLQSQGRWSGELWNRRKNGSELPVWLSINAMYDDEGTLTHYIAVFSDISAIKKAEAEREFLTHYDQLTRLPNRALLQDRLHHALDRARRRQQPMALLFIDLDRFQQINDSFGHALGDELLRQTASLLRQCLRSSDTLARVGGDEFVAILEDNGSAQAASDVANKLLAQMSQVRPLGKPDLFLSCSIGISLYPEDSDDETALLTYAELALTQAKQLGRNHFAFYNTQMSETMLERMLLENSLRNALKRHEFTLYYQPQIDLHSGRVEAAEALLRWISPELGLVSPVRFIPIAEELGLMTELGAEVLEQACAQLSQWQQDALPIRRIAINLSAQQLEQTSFADKVLAVTRRYALEPAQLELEVTESILMQRQGNAAQNLQQLHHAGFEIAVDDFGTGYSCLSYIKSLPIRRLKIDRSFVKEITHDKASQAIVHTVIDLADNLGFDTIAEGIEGKEQAVALQRLGCRLGQGFLWSKPLPPTEFVTRLHLLNG